MMKKFTIPLIIMLIVMMLIPMSGCSGVYYKYSYEFFGTFDTVIRIIGYERNSSSFNRYAKQAKQRFTELHKLYDIYNDYPGINNIKTINDHAGLEPVKVRQEIIDLIGFAKAYHHEVSEKVNIAMGPVLKVWHEYRTAGNDDQAAAQLPPMDALRAAMEYTDIDKVIVDQDNSTVYLEDPGMMLDVGAIAKGFATEIVSNELRDSGLQSVLISSGGNVRAIGEPLDDRLRWGVGLQSPFDTVNTTQEALLDTVFVTDQSVVTSGDYQRFYVVDGQRVHHLIDPDTLQPATYYSAVTVMTLSSAQADFLSTAIFLMPYEESRALVDRLEGVEALWVFPDGHIEATDAMIRSMKKLGGASSK